MSNGSSPRASRSPALRPQTTLITSGRPADEPGQPLNVPIVLASNFRAGHQGQATGRSYSRDDATPGWEALEEVIGELEGGVAVAFGSGMAAAAAVFDLLPAGARVVAPTDCYLGVRALLETGQQLRRWRTDLVDITDTAVTVAAARQADLVWLESPTNPLLDIADLPAVCAAAREAGALVAVDNTFATPLLQQPIALGAHIAMHSATKFFGGHSDLLLGVVVADSPELGERLRHRRELAGAVPGALEAFLVLRGLRTLALRVDQGQRSAAELARRLASHPAVSRVRYPGLPDDPGHARAAAQMTGFGAVLGFEVETAAAADALCDSLRVIRSATSLGGVESTIERRGKLPGQDHLPPGFLRFSVGCEHIEDLWDDLTAALAQPEALT
ncbi:MAG TPA: PLP-dependent aspartate aminotransferase family protein [Streptosporangiaceae bacterium]|nr:PLP-dependent aspartate aminotransferase family protein [Streptosporangiaceae bacterium]